MDRMIVYVDDAAYAQQVLAPLLARPAAAGAHWTLVACAPRMTHRISKWVSHSARENLRTKWADKLFAQMLPALRIPASRMTTVVAKGPLAELTEQLQQQQQPPLSPQAGDAAAPSAAQVVDARRPRLPHGGPEAPGTPHGPLSSASRPGTLGSWAASLGLLWVLSAE